MRSWVQGEKSEISAEKAAEVRAGFTFMSFRATTTQGLYFYFYLISLWLSPKIN